jgi:hypothetical protein
LGSKAKAEILTFSYLIGLSLLLNFNRAFMKKLILLTFPLFLLYSCSDKSESGDKKQSDTISVHKKNLAEELPPPSDIRQFKWFYSGFVKMISLHADSLLNRLIHPELGLYIIESKGTMPKMTHVKDFSEFKTKDGKAFYDFDAQVLVCDIKEEEFPKVDCNAKDLYSKTGCFTKEGNTLKDDKVWEFCNLSKSETDNVQKSLLTVTRTVLLTNNYAYYFSLIKGGWWLTFVDMRKPCGK